jgi:hypothetical protein
MKILLRPLSGQTRLQVFYLEELMSRSVKKVPIIRHGKFDKTIRRWNNKKIRALDVNSNGDYKKIREKYGIYDDRYKSNLYKNCGKMYDGRPMTFEEIMEYWRK